MSKMNQDELPGGAFVEFQVDILTSDENNFVNNFYESRCKGMIKVCNRPVIYYAIKNVIEQKLKYITILVNEPFYEEMNEYIQTAFPENYKSDDKKIKNSVCIDIITCPLSSSGEELGTVECLLQIKNKIKSDFVLLNCDIFGFVDIHSLANLFRGENAMCAMLFLEDEYVYLNNTDRKKKGLEENELLNLENNIWACIDKNSKVVAIKDALSMKQNGKMKISKYHLIHHKNCILKTDLIDSHVYIFKKYIFDILIEKREKFTSIKYDLIPYLVKMQNTPKILSFAKPECQFNMYNTLIDKYDGSESHKMSLNKCLLVDILENDNMESVVCYVQPTKAGVCQRINTIVNLLRANILFCVPRHDQLKHLLPSYCFYLLTEKNHSYRDCVISNHFTREENVVLRKCIIGKNVNIKKKTTICRSVILDKVQIEENCMIENCLICDNVVIQSNCKLIDCIIKENAIIEKDSFFEKETLPLFINS